MRVAKGQLAFVHKECRKKARREGLKEAVEDAKRAISTPQINFQRDIIKLSE